MVFVMSLGESLWKRFIPKYLEMLGAPVTAIGLFGTTEDFLDGVYQYPGGWLGDRLGRRPSLMLFIGAAGLGYVAYWMAPSWPWIFAGVVLVMAWSSMASPTLFAVIGDALPSNQRAMGFTVQSIVKRIPVAAGPTIGGAVIGVYGLRTGIRSLLLVSIALAVLAATAAAFVRVSDVSTDPATIRHVWSRLPRDLRRLLLSDVFIRTCEGMVDVFLVLYATNIVGVTPAQFGVLLAIQALTSIAIYLPVSRLSDRGRRKPFVTATFVFFALFPMAVVLSEGMWGLAAAFVVGGLRELGEPSRKALIVGMAEPAIRGRTVGLYYLIRSVAISPAAFVGGMLWRMDPAVPFLVAACFGLIGTMVFAATVDEEHAG
jgi:MFS family permease